MRSLKGILSIALLSLIVFSCQDRSISLFYVQPLPVDAALNGDILTGPSVLNDPNRFVWGASVVMGHDGNFHMLYSTWECGDSIPQFSHSWLLHSKIAYAISEQPNRGFTFQKIVLRGRALDGDTSAWDAQMVHNPHIKKFNGKYYLYYIGSMDPGIQPAGSKGEKLNKRNRVQQSQKIGVIEFNSFEDLVTGNFKRPDKPLLSPRTRVKENNIVDPSAEGTLPKPDNIIVVNPSVVYRHSDGKYLLYFKGNLYDPRWRGVHGVAIADAPDGPFHALETFVFDIAMDDGKIASAEDPYVWYHPALGKFFAVIKDFSGRITGSDPGLAILESMDGITWKRPGNPFFMKKELKLENGYTIELNRLERPQLLIEESGDPEVLYCASSIVDINPRTDGVSFNVHIPLKTVYE
jgi:hypothetical protein